jgi:hypothetical protein
MPVQIKILFTQNDRAVRALVVYTEQRHEDLTTEEMHDARQALEKLTGFKVVIEQML